MMLSMGLFPVITIHMDFTPLTVMGPTDAVPSTSQNAVPSLSCILLDSLPAPQDQKLQ
jgi:hypothetical protein